MKKQLIAAIPWVFIGLGIFLLIAGNIANKHATEKNRAVGLQNNTYLRTMTCIASVSPTLRTPAYVKSCYDQAEQQTGVEVTRFGDGR
jgi:hypothetical protein